MKEKLTLAEKLHKRKIKQPPRVIYPLLGYVWKLLYWKKLGVRLNDKVNAKKLKGPFIVVNNHASRMDYIYTGIPFLPKRLNYVSAYNEFFRSHLRGIFHLLQIIPKRNFTPDLYTIKQISRILKSGGRVCIFPEGVSSISGESQPVALGTAKMLKHFGVPVYYTKISGGCLTTTKYCLDERYGRVDVTIDQMFTPEQLKQLSEDEITDIVNEKLYNDEYEWNKTARASYKGKGQMAHNLNDLLYYCPKCRSEYEMVGEGDKIVCKKCGNGAVLTEQYDFVPLDDTCVIPESISKWQDLQREVVRNEVLANPNYKLCEKALLGTLPEYKPLKNYTTAESVGEGKICISRDGFTYTGTKKGEPFTFTIPTDSIPTLTIATDCAQFFTYLKGVYYEFTPENRRLMKFLLATEEIHRANDGKWQDFKFKKK